jgi:light-regulated signal transduction histidine kinase (bacteriophytochrome)
MKPLLSESEDNDALQALGRASVQIVHDLKNQLNGLKLYATFLRKRMEKSERPDDELETINKLIAGLDRTARDVSMIVEFGRPLDLKKQSGTDLEKLARDVAASLNAENLSNRPPVTGGLSGSIVVDAESAALVGDFDRALLGEAFKWISLSAIKMSGHKDNPGSLAIRLKGAAIESGREGVMEWSVFDSSDHDPFHSFAGSNEVRLSLAARIIEAHGGSASRQNGVLCVRLPLAPVIEGDREQDS